MWFTIQHGDSFGYLRGSTKTASLRMKRTTFLVRKKRAEPRTM